MDRRWLYLGGGLLAAIVIVAIGYEIGARVMPGGRRSEAMSEAAALPGVDTGTAIPTYSGPPVVSRQPTSAPPALSAAERDGPDTTLPTVGDAAPDSGAVDDTGNEIVAPAVSSDTKTPPEGAAQ